MTTRVSHLCRPKNTLALPGGRAMKYRAMGLHERELSDDEMVRLMAQEYTFVTRPMIVAGGRATVGFSAKRIDDLGG
jgi:arsenate reductase (glutaredoxin)